MTQQQIAQQMLDKFGVRAKFYPDGKLILKYVQHDNKKWQYEITKECRGLILDWKDNYKVLAWPFYKFFNHFETKAAKIDWSTAVAYEKYDGTCLTVYNDRGIWNWSTMQMANCEGFILGLGERTFRDLAEPFVMKVIPNLDKRRCYTFEMCTQENKLISHYDNPEFRLIGSRLIDDPEEKYPEIDISKETAFNLPDMFSVQDLNQVINMAEALPELREGYVIVDANFNRIKVKSTKYWAGFRLVNNVTTKIDELVKLALYHDSEEILHYLPDYKEVYMWWEIGLDVLIKKVEKFHIDHKDMDRPDYAKLALAELPRAAWLAFNLYDGSTLEVRDMINQRLLKNGKSACNHLKKAINFMV